MMKAVWLLGAVGAAFLAAAACGSDSQGTGGTSSSSGSGGAGASTSSSSSSSSSGMGGTGGTGGSTGGTGGAAMCPTCVTLAQLPSGSQPYGITVDATSVYWTNSGSGEVMKIGTDGMGQVTLAANQGAPFAVEIDNGFAVWVSYSVDGVMRKAPIGGGAAVDIFLAPAARDLVVNGGTVYWTREPDDIQSVPVDGLPDGGVEGLLTANPLSNGIATDGSQLFWCNRQDGYVKKCEFDLTGETPLATGDIPWSIAVDGTSIYWSERGSSQKTGKIVKASKVDGSGLVEIATGLASPLGVAVDATSVYWANSGDGTIHKAPIGGGADTVIAMGQMTPTNLVVDGTHVYWTDPKADTVMKAPK